MTKTLITGGAGFIGSHLADHLLSKGHEIHIVDNLSRGVKDAQLLQLEKRGAKFLNRNLLLPNTLEDLGTDYDTIYHLAAIVGVIHVLEKPYSVLQDNILIHLNLLNFAKKQSKLKRFVFASTSEVYAGTLQHFTLPLPTPESTPMALPDLNQPRTSYMLSKIYGEALCHHSEVPFTIIRPHNIYGPRMGLVHVIPELMKKIHNTAQGSQLEVFSVDHRRTFCFIEDAIELITRAAEIPSCNRQTFNIGNQEPEITIGELTSMIQQTVGKKLTLTPRPATLGSPARRCPDMNHVIALTGYKPKISLQVGIQRTYAWYKENIFSGQEISAR